MSPARADVVLLAPEEETVPEHSEHVEVVDLLRAGLVRRFADRDDVAVHGRLAWFPDRDDTRVRLDPDVSVTFDRPPALRKSWRSWDEDGAAPDVIVEVWSEDDSAAGYRTRLERAYRYGTAEVVLVDPFAVGGVLVRHLVRGEDGWETAAVSVSPEDVVHVARLGVDLSGGAELVVSDEYGVWTRTGQAYIRAAQADAEAARADAEAARADTEAARADTEAARADTEAARADTAAVQADSEAARADSEAARADNEAARAERLGARFREMGVDPDA